MNLYEERTDSNGPAMTHSMFAIGWLELGDKDRAEKPFLKNFQNIRGPFKVSRVSTKEVPKDGKPSLGSRFARISNSVLNLDSSKTVKILGVFKTLFVVTEE